MISIYDIKNWSDVAAFLIWTLAVCAIAKALFGSLLAAEIQYRFSLRDAPRRQRMNRLHWEINNRASWDQDVARRSPHAAKQSLSDLDIETRRQELQQLARSSLTWRAVTYFVGCVACQTFWVAGLIYVLTRGATDPTAWFLTSAAYSGAAILVSRYRIDESRSRATPTCTNHTAGDRITRHTRTPARGPMPVPWGSRCRSEQRG